MGLHCRSIRIKEAGYSIVVAITIKYQNEIRTILLTTLSQDFQKYVLLL